MVLWDSSKVTFLSRVLSIDDLKIATYIYTFYFYLFIYLITTYQLTSYLLTCILIAQLTTIYRTSNYVYMVCI